MNQINEENKSELPIPEESETTEIPEQPEPGAQPEAQPESQPEAKPVIKAEKAQPSRMKKFFHQALIWLIVIVVTFGAGFLLDHFLRYRPLANDLRDSQSALETANLEMSDLTEENQQLTTKNGAANDQITSLEEELEAATAYLQYYQVLVDVNNARISLFLEDMEGAKAALLQTQDRLEDLLPFIIEVDSELALSLPRRLELIVAGLERDPETAKIDLELFTKDLLQLEPLIFGN